MQLIDGNDDDKKTTIKMYDAEHTDENRSGKFGYEILDKNQYIPYIYRGNEKFCPVKVLQWHIDRLNIKANPGVSAYPYLTSYEMYRGDAILFNEINQWHNNYLYPYIFRASDKLIKSSDCRDMFVFICDCEQKSHFGELYVMRAGAGLMQIQWKTPQSDELMESVWPFISKDGKRYVPVEFLKESCHALSATIVLNGIDVMYMRYLYTALKHDTSKMDFKMPCIELDEAISHLLSVNDSTYVFDDNYWPTKKRTAPKALLPSQPLPSGPRSMMSPLLLGSRIKNLNNNHLDFFSKKQTNTDRVKVVSEATKTATAPPPAAKVQEKAVASADAVDDSKEANATEINRKVNLFEF